MEPVIEKVVHDSFFTEQPVRGARVYSYHNILHDWSDKYCREILRRVAFAMTPGYSKLLLHKIIVLEEGAPQIQAQLDMTMMAFNGGMERMAKQWREILEDVGLRVMKIWEQVEEVADGIIKQ